MWSRSCRKDGPASLVKAWRLRHRAVTTRCRLSSRACSSASDGEAAHPHTSPTAKGKRECSASELRCCTSTREANCKRPGSQRAGSAARRGSGSLKGTGHA
eukprot:1161672-Pelagomonas_calceolata.AAC.2